MKPVDQLYSGPDENSPQNKGTQDSPKEHTMLLLFRNGEVIEDDEENKEIVDAQGELDHIAGNELEAGLTPLPEIQNGGEGSRLAMRSTRLSRPKPVSTTVAPSACATRATWNAIEASVMTPVTRIRLPARIPITCLLP